MIKKCDFIIANLNPFRGKEPDSGTVWECGFASGLGKTVWAFMDDTSPYIDSFSENEKSSPNTDLQNRCIEDFDSPLNLMLQNSITDVVQGNLEQVLKKIIEKTDTELI